MGYPTIAYPLDYPISRDENEVGLRDALFAHMDKDMSIALATTLNHGKPFRGNIYPPADFTGDVVASKQKVLQPTKNPWDR